MKYKVIRVTTAEFETALNEQYADLWVLISWNFDNTDKQGSIRAVLVKGT